MVEALVEAQVVAHATEVKRMLTAADIQGPLSLTLIKAIPLYGETVFHLRGEDGKQYEFNPYDFQGQDVDHMGLKPNQEIVYDPAKKIQ